MEESLVQLACLKEACKRLGLTYTEHDQHGNLLSVSTQAGTLYFANFATQFNSGAVEQICRDKEFSYVLLNSVVRMPKTKGYFDPDYTREEYEWYRTFKTKKEIVSDIFKNFSPPVVVKRNSGARGGNVFLCNDEDAVSDALSAIFSKESPEYDYVALTQEHVTTAAEYRAVVFRGEIVLFYAYEPKFPISHSMSRLNLDIDKVAEFLSPIFKILPVEFAGFDIIEDKDGKLYLLEINTRPGFAKYIARYGRSNIEEMYRRILKDFT